MILTYSGYPGKKLLPELIDISEYSREVQAHLQHIPDITYDNLVERCMRKVAGTYYDCMKDISITVVSRSGGDDL